MGMGVSWGGVADGGRRNRRPAVDGRQRSRGDATSVLVVAAGSQRRCLLLDDTERGLIAEIYEGWGSGEWR